MGTSRSLRKYSFLARTSLVSKVAYPIDILFRTFFFGLVLYIFTQLWGALLGTENSIAGFSRQQLVWYLVVTESVMLSNARIERRIEDEIKSGAVAYILIRPLHFVWYQCSIYLGESLGSLVFNAVVGAIIATLLVGMPPIAAGFLPFVIALMLIAFILQFLIKMSLSAGILGRGYGAIFLDIQQDTVYLGGVICSYRCLPRVVETNCCCHAIQLCSIPACPPFCEL